MYYCIISINSSVQFGLWSSLVELYQEVSADPRMGIVTEIAYV